jgi:cysteine-rich repeat protein
VRLTLLAFGLVGGCISELPPCTDGVCGVLTDGTADSTETAVDASDPTFGPTIATTIPVETTNDGASGTEAQTCGDEQITGDEACDDGNLVNGDGCNADCQPSLRVLDKMEFGGVVGGRDVGRGIGVSDDGMIVVGGADEDVAGPLGVVRGLGPDLQPLWTQPLFMLVSTSEAYGVVVEESGWSAVAGTIESGAARRAVVAYYDSSGQLAWADDVGSGTALDAAADARAVTVDNFGDVYVGGFLEVAGQDLARLSRYVANGPPEQFDVTVAAAAGAGQYVRGVAILPPTTVVYAGLQTTAEGNAGLLGFYPDGGVAPVTFGSDAVGNGVAVSLAGDALIVVGSLSGGTVAWAAGYDSSLQPLWTQEFAGAVGAIHDVVVAPDGSYYVVGDAQAGPSGDVLVAHLDITGVVLASETHDLGGGTDSGRAIAYDPTDDTLLITGEEQIVGADYDAFVVRLAL